MGIIYWTQFDWQSFSTLATGAAAVGAAIIVGLRQAGIASSQTEIAARQAKILERQVALDELDLRSSLFDRRQKVYAATRGFLAPIVRGDKDGPTNEKRYEFLTQVEQATFLFSNEIAAKLEEIWQAGALHLAVKGVNAAKDANGIPHPDGTAQEDATMEALVKYSNDLIDIFGDEMRLSAIQVV